LNVFFVNVFHSFLNVGKRFFPSEQRFSCLKKPSSNTSKRLPFFMDKQSLNPSLNAQKGVLLPEAKSLFGFVFFLILPLFYCVTLYWTGELKAVHLFLTGFVLLCYFGHAETRLFVILSIPVILKDIVYDYLRYIPFHWLTPIHVKQPYDYERTLFGISQGGRLLTPNEFLAQYFSAFFDFISGIMYFLNEPMAILMIIYLWKMKNNRIAARYAMAFFIMYGVAYVTYVLYAAAPPWYVAKYGFLQPSGFIPGDPAGMARFDQLIGLPLSAGFYNLSPVVFGAIPSMHAGAAMLIWLYSKGVGKKSFLFFGGYFLLMCFAAVYLQHHYIIDLIIGALYALGAWGIVEKIFPSFAQSLANFSIRKFFYFPFYIFSSKKKSHVLD